ncbi:cytochrome P450 [Nannocystaceae bacterium ST9]
MWILDSFTLDPDDAGFVADPSAAIDFLLAHAPIFPWVERDAVVVSRMSFARALLVDPRASSSREPSPARLPLRTILALRARLRTSIDARIEGLVARGESVLQLRELADHIAIASIAEFLGIAADEFVRAPRLEPWIAARRAAPLDHDPISTWIAEGLRDDELLAHAEQIVAACGEPLVHALCLSAYELLTHPDALHEVQSDRSRLANAIAEAERVNGVDKLGPTRVVREPFELAGVPLCAGQVVIVFRSAANRDPEVFREPEVFDIHRDTTPAIADQGLAAELVRMVQELAIGRLLIERFPDATLAGELRFTAHPTLRAVASLPIRLA